MFATGSKLFLVLSGALFVAAIVYGLASGGDPVGVVSVGYKGGVGDHFGYSLLLAGAALHLCLGVFAVLVGDANLEAGKEVETQTTATVPQPHPWGVLTAFGVACLALGLALSGIFAILGLVVLALVALEWSVLAWADRATEDPTTNSTVRDRFMAPVEVPLLATLIIAAGVIGGSRVLLAVPHAAATAIAAIFAAVVFFGGVLLAKTTASRSLITAFVAVLCVAVLGGGIAGAVVGEYESHSHDEETHESEDEETESGDEEETGDEDETE